MDCLSTDYPIGVHYSTQPAVTWRHLFRKQLRLSDPNIQQFGSDCQRIAGTRRQFMAPDGTERLYPPTRTRGARAWCGGWVAGERVTGEWVTGVSG